ncbi:MAG: peptidoglycan-binding protein LysM [bacterium]
MGLFSFANDIGKRIFGGDDDPAEKLQAHIAEDNPGIQDLSVEVEGDTAVLKGEAETPEALEKAVLMAGNTLGIGAVEASEVSAPEQTAEVEFYDIQEGDNLWKIAVQFYGDGTKYTKIFEENREVIKDPDLIFVGQKIRIPIEAA